MRLFGKKPETTGRRRSLLRGNKDNNKNPTFSYYQNRDFTEQRGPKPEKRRRNRMGFLRQIPGYLAALAIVASLLYSMTLTATPKVIVVNEQEKAVQAFLRSPETYQEIMQEGFKGSIFNRTKVTINTTRLADLFKQRLPEATDVSITLPLIGRNPVVYVRIAAPTLLLTNDANQSFVVDEQGRAVVESSQLPNAGELNLLSVSDKSGISLEPGKAVLPEDHIQFMKDVRTQLTAAHITVGRVILPTRVNELRVYPKGSRYFIKFNFLLDPREQVGRYLAVKNRTNNQTTQYVDVRVPDRVYLR